MPLGGTGLPFREKLKDVLPSLPAQDDYFLLKWLRARAFDLPKAEAMLRKHLEVRKYMDADNIIAWEPPEVCPQRGLSPCVPLSPPGVHKVP
uniref:CRAL/TRIO N-terminal domain-containing protein n=1 Tax=Malurus cyaneus samueli TaxID=2593467 RepID=A0A8C5X605_9PASS